MDFICKGGASPRIYEDFIKYYQKKAHIKVDDIIFRDKRKYQYQNAPILCRRLIVRGENSSGSTQLYYNRKINDRFHDNLFAGVLQQKACEKCKFHSYNHCSDITCGDFHRYNLDDDFKDDLGISEILVNSEKIEKVIHMIDKSPQVLQCTKKDVWQPLLEKDAKIWPLKPLFWKIYKKRGFESASRLILLRIWRVRLQRFAISLKNKLRMVGSNE